MPDRKPARIDYLRCLVGFCLIFGTVCAVFAERLSFKTYSTADGLAHDNINKIVADSRGFLWFCTSEGLSRFDGYQFKNYTQEQGLPHRSINDFLETSDGTYLIATSGGLAVFNPTGKAYRWNIIEEKLEQNVDAPPIFKTYYPPDIFQNNLAKIVTGLAEDGRGNIYAGTTQALFRFELTDTDREFKRVEYPEWSTRPVTINYMLTDARKNIWIAASHAVYWLSGNGDILKMNEKGGNAIFEDRAGQIWIDSGGNDIGIRVYSYEKDNSAPVLIRTYTRQDGLIVNGFSNALAQTRDGRIFAESSGKLLEFLPRAKENELKFRLLENEVANAATDKSGNVWFSVPGKGAAKYTPDSFTVYDERDGIPKSLIRSIIGRRPGELVFTTGKNQLVRFADGRFEVVEPFGFKGRHWIDTFLDFPSKDGEWWIPSNNGLLRYPKVAKFADLARTRPKKIYTTADGLFNDTTYNLFEDSRGDVWFGTADADNSLLRWEKATEKIYRYTFEDGIPKSSGVVSYGEDAAGNVWIGFFYGQLARYKDGRFRMFKPEDGFPRGGVSDMLSDKAGRLWLATSSRGLFRVDNPDSETPFFANLSTAHGLSSNQMLCLTEDLAGRIYAGTGGGINRIEPDSGRIKIFNQEDGLPGNIIYQCDRTLDGTLWFSSSNSLIRFAPQADSFSKPPPIFIAGLSVNGSARPVSELGETEIKNLELAPDEKQIQISFFAVSLGTGETLRYQYKLEGEDWSPPAEQRNISFNLSAGDYIFMVQAVNSDGVVSESPARISFRILPPVWQRWWFLTLSFLLVGGAIFGLDRYRVAKTRQVQRALVESKESENRFRTLADTASDVILTIDEDSTIIFVNQAIEKVFGYTADELMGRKLTMLMPERMRGGHDAGLNRFLKTKRKNINWSGVALPGLHKSGEEIPLEVSFGEFERDGKLYFTGIARDVSERRRAEEALQKAREEKFRELERVRARIATDLHDDIGSSLTQIAVLTEVARGQASFLQAENLSTPLERIKTVSKELVAVMSDVVWAINPQKDFLHDLVQRMRRFASDVFTTRGIKFEFVAPEIDGSLQLGANIRREVFAIFKESVNNAVKYSECTAARAEFRIEDSRLILEISDNGQGFDTAMVLSDRFKPEMGGNGLINMRRRAEELGGTCEIRSETGRGTTINLVVPLHFQKNGAEKV